MLEVIAKLNDKKLTLSQKSLGNKLDNSTTLVVFPVISGIANLTNKYVAFLNPNNEIFLFPLNKEYRERTNENGEKEEYEVFTFIVTQALTQTPGSFSMLFLSTSQAVDNEGNIPSDSKMFISNATQFTIQDNFLDDRIEEVIVDENLELIYDRLEREIIYLSSEEFKNELLEGLKLTEEDLNTITNNLKNDETFKEEIKGEKGEKGDNGISTYEEYTIYNTFMNDNLPIVSNKFYLNDEILLNTIESLPSRTEIFRNNRFKYYFNNQDGLRIFWYGLDVEVTSDSWWRDRSGFIFIHREQAGSESDLWYFDNGQTTSDYCFEDVNFNTMVSNPYLLTTREKVISPEEFASQFEKGPQGDTYTITEADYDAIANVVLSKMVNAEEVDY